MNHNLSSIKVGMLVVASLSVTACFSSSSSSSSDEPLLINAVNDSFTVLGNGEHQLDVLVNDEGENLTLESVGSASHGSVTVSGGALLYTPDTNFAGIDTFIYSISNETGEASAQVEVEVGQPVGLQGRVIDAPIANAQVTLSFNGQTFTTEADEQGRYELPLVVNTLEDNELVRLTARGSAEHNQEYITLSARLMTAGELLALVGSGNSIARDQLDAVQVTQLTTARDFLITRAAGEDKVTGDNVAELENVLDPDLLLEMAAVIKLMVDDPDFSLPEGKATIEEFLNDEESYNEVVIKASEGGENSPLSRAMEETLNDPEIMPSAAIQLQGEYLVMFDTAPFMVSRSGLNFTFNSDGTARRTSGALDGATMPGRFSYHDFEWSLANGRVDFTSDTALSRQDAQFPMHEFIADEATRDAFLEAYGEYGYVTYTQRETHLRSFQILSVTARDIVIRQTVEYIWERPEGYLTFQYNGETYYAKLVEGPLAQTVTTNSRLVEVDHLKRSNLKFENVSAQPWILTDLYGYTGRKAMFDLNPDGTATLAIDDHYYYWASFYYLQNEDWTAHWALHDNDTRLRITLRDNEGNLITHTDFFWNRNDYTAQGLVTLYSNAHGESYASVDQGGPVPNAEITPQDITAQLNSSNMLASAVNRQATAYEGAALKPSDWFGWILETNGTGQSPIFRCDGQRLSAYELCEGNFTVLEPGEELLEWEIANGSIHIERFPRGYNRSDCHPAEEFYDATTPCYRRVITPLRQADNGVVLGVEYNIISSWASGAYTNEPRPLYQVEPRFMAWTIETLPEAAEERADLYASKAFQSRLVPFTTGYMRAFPSSHIDNRDGQR